MLKSTVAAVRPRVVAPETGEPVPLEDLLAELHHGRQRLVVQLVGAGGTGKSVAIRHLASIFKGDDVLLLDDPPPEQISRLTSSSAMVVFAASRMTRGLADLSLQLADWGDDELLEYLLACHPQQVSSVWERIRTDSFRSQIDTAEVWSRVLDEMARYSQLPDIRSALHSSLDRELRPSPLRKLARRYSLAMRMLPNAMNIAVETQRHIMENFSGTPVLRLLRHRAPRLLLAAEELVELAKREPTRRLDRVLDTTSADLIAEAGRRVASRWRWKRRFKKWLFQPKLDMAAIGASVLHAAGYRWSPTKRIALRRAHLEGIQWPEVNLAECVLSAALLNRADLSGANLKQASLVRARLRGANLQRANLEQAYLGDTDLTGADLSHAVARSTYSRKVLLRYANCSGADFSEAHLVGADLTGASFRQADLSQTNFFGAKIEEADFREACFYRAKMTGLPLRRAKLARATFRRAQLQNCDLEFVQLPAAQFEQADLSGAWMTGSAMVRGNFRQAVLCGAGLADTCWAWADLRNADLRGCQFQMGSSRSGLVGSPYPGHGSRTGFYTDAYDELYFRHPEEVRKADLRGADLRGAKIAGVDFYLVDLRGAKFDPEAELHLRSCKAILEDDR